MLDIGSFSWSESKSSLHNKSPKQHKIIFLNNYYWPDESATSQLLIDLAEHIASRNVQAVVVTSRHLYNGKEGCLPRAERRNGVRIIRIWTTKFGRQWLPGRSIDNLTFHLVALFVLLAITNRDDRIVAKTDPPLISIVAWIAAKTKRASLINWCQDLFPEVGAALGIRSLRGLIGGALTSLRNRSLHGAAMNVTISSSMRNALCLQGIRPDQLRAIHNWPDRCIEPMKTGAIGRRRRWRLTEGFVIGYSGNLGRAHLPQELLKLIKALSLNSRIAMLFVGGGYGMRLLRDEVDKHGYDNVVFKPRQPRDELNDTLAVPDVHLISLHPSCEDLIMPSKYYGILAAGKVVAFLGRANTGLAKEINDYGCGIVLDVEKPEAWAEQLLWLEGNRGELLSMQQKARQLYEERFTQEAALGAWEDVILGALEGEAKASPVMIVD